MGEGTMPRKVAVKVLAHALDALRAFEAFALVEGDPLGELSLVAIDAKARLELAREKWLQRAAG